MTQDRDLVVRAATIQTPSGRPLFEDLHLHLGPRERVAVLGRNGVGKSTLLTFLQAGVREEGVVRRPSLVLVAQHLTGERCQSPGEQRRHALAIAFASDATLLMLDEPTSDLDEEGVAWLRHALRRWPRALLVATHDPRLLSDFEHFFLLREGGAFAFSGTRAELERKLSLDQANATRRYSSALQRHDAFEARVDHVTRRKARKKRYGRASEIDRATPRIRLNRKRGEAQVSHGRQKRIREARLEEVRLASKAARRAIDARLALDLGALAPLEDARRALELRVVIEGTRIQTTNREILLRVSPHSRVGVVGPNGSGKTTLLELIVDRLATAAPKLAAPHIGVIAQGGVDWLLDESLGELLERARVPSGEVPLTVAEHGFPPALAERPLVTLSPGERTRAALITLSHRAPTVLVLDEPTYSLDRTGQRAVARALSAWPSALVVASHDPELLDAIGVTQLIKLGT